MRWACTAQNGLQYLYFISMFYKYIVSEQCEQATANIKDDYVY